MQLKNSELSPFTCVAKCNDFKIIVKDRQKLTLFIAHEHTSDVLWKAIGFAKAFTMYILHVLEILRVIIFSILHLFI